MRKVVAAVLALLVVPAAALALFLAQPVTPPGPPPPRPVEERWPTDLDLASIATVGDLPPAAGAAVLAVDEAGVLTVDGEVTHVGNLREALRPRADALRRPATAENRRPLSDLDVVLALHRRTSWGVAQRLIERAVAADCPRVFFAVRRPEGGAPGAVATFIPSDRCEHCGHPCCTRERRIQERKVVVDLDDGADSCRRPIALADLLRRESAGPRKLVVVLEIAADVPMQSVLDAVDVAARCGASSAEFAFGGPWTDRGAAPGCFPPAGPADDLGRVRLRVPDEQLVVPSVPPAIPSRVVGGYAGFVSPPASH